MRLSPKQKEYWTHATHRWNVKEGATRSGKTYLDYFMIPKRIRACHNGGLIVMLGNTQGTLRRNLLDPMREIWTDRLVGSTISDNTVQLFGKTVYVLGADKVNQVSKIQGAGIEYCYGDEVTTWHEDVFSMLKSRLSYPNSTFDGTCNPDAPTHWFLDFLKGDSDIYRQSYTLDDNPFLDSRVAAEIRRDYAGTVYYDRFVLGRWVRAEGLVYPAFNADEHIARTLPTDGLWYISCDYGTMNPFSAGLWCVTPERAVRVAEYYYDGRKEKRQQTDEEYYAALEKLAGDRVIQDIVVDPSAASFIETIRRHGRFRVQKANNSVLDGIRHTARLLAAGKVQVAENCADSIREFGAYAWDDKAGEDQVIKENDHAMDDMRYFCMTILRGVYRW
ncbi:PBSX family phage terminase large subunit [Butyricicoccus faecihominis]|uniref:PBSX family phage terminase large subunit n=1 Tax=Butyricicoccus faecihominis TaxID=1712515 RepID=UPI00247A49AF|nr:PBSX family phage terminase large subunit [Butyricicoccus faecihominis]MCQ5130844.1 PBSX family phage terminase large subunit [Butyricicoccus faecihominis]